MVFTYRLRLLPAFGAAGFDADFLPPAARLADRLRHLALPLATLTLVGIGGTARFVRGAMLDVAGAPYVTVARSKGLSETRVMLRHVRNALIPVVLARSLPPPCSRCVVHQAISPGPAWVACSEAVQACDYPVSWQPRRERQLWCSKRAGGGARELGRPEGTMRSDSRRLFRDHRAAVGAGVLALAVLAALVAPLLAGDPIAQRDIVATRFLPPLATDPLGAFHLLGTDRFGRDVWARLVYGARISLGVGTLAVLLSVLIGVGRRGGGSSGAAGFGVALLGLTDFALALPVVLLPAARLAVAAERGAHHPGAGTHGWMTIARLVYAEVRSLARPPVRRERDRTRGVGSRVLVRRILRTPLRRSSAAALRARRNAILLRRASRSWSGRTATDAKSWVT
jgi:ABC-type dipeptide/oligopeptide/nickel transport system permease subunit